jgi:hypothetical protein
MSPVIRLTTSVLLVLPAGLVVGGLVTKSLFAAPVALGMAQPVLFGVAAFLALLYVAVWLWFRPLRFVVAPDGLRIVWPLRWSHVAMGEIVEIQRLGAAEFRQEFGLGVRVGVGGLWGAFGLLVTGKETLVMYVSRADDLVLVRRASGRALLLTPADPARFVAALERRGG